MFILSWLQNTDYFYAKIILMRTFVRKLLFIAVLAFPFAMLVNLFTPVTEVVSAKTYCECTNTYSDGSTLIEEGAETAIFGDGNGCYCGGVNKIIQFGIDTFTIGVVVLATIGIIWVGYLIMTARDNQEQVSQAKRRIVQIVIGIVAFVMFDVLISLFLPGGIIDSAPTIIATSSEKKEYEEPDLSPPDKEPSGSNNPGGSTKPSNLSNDNKKTATKVSEAVWNNGNECSATPIWSATKYNLTDEEIKYFSELVAIENCRSTSSKKEVVMGCKLLASQIINLYEERKHDRGGKEGCGSGGACYYKDMKKWVTHDEWYQVNKYQGGLRYGKYMNSNSTAAVKDVIVNGNRVLPKFVSRYDGLYHWTKHYSGFINLGSIEAASKAIPMKTKVKSGERYLWCIERKQTSNKANGPYNEVFNYDDRYRRAVGM